MSEFKINNIIIPEELPVIALKNTVLFPKLVIPIIIQRPKSVAALDFALTHNRLVLFTTQKNSEDDISRGDLYKTGTVGRIVSVRSEEHTSELQSPDHLVCRLLLE